MELEEDWRLKKPSLAQSIYYLLDTNLYTDMTFTIGSTKEVFNSHKLIVMARSEVFATNLQERWNNLSNRDTLSNIDIPNASPETFNYFLKYLYTDNFPAPIDDLTIEDAIEVMKLAHQYRVMGLVEKCSLFLISKINLQTCVKIYNDTQLYPDQEVSHVSLDFIRKNIIELTNIGEFFQLDPKGLFLLLQSDELNINETDLFKALLRWNDQAIQNDPNHPQNMLQSLVRLIRFPVMGLIEFAKEIVPTGILSDQEVTKAILEINGSQNSGCERKYRAPHKYVKCYETEEVCDAGYIQKWPSRNSLYPQFRFKCNKQIHIRGFVMYGPRTINAMELPESKHNLEYDLALTINADNNNHAEPAQKTTTIPIIRCEDFQVFLDRPLKVEADKPYWINLSVKLKTLPFKLLGSQLQNRFSFGVRTFIQGQEEILSSNEQGLVFKMLMCSRAFSLSKHYTSDQVLHFMKYDQPEKPIHSLGLIHSIIYTS